MLLPHQRCRGPAIPEPPCRYFIAIVVLAEGKRGHYKEGEGQHLPQQQHAVIRVLPATSILIPSHVSLVLTCAQDIMTLAQLSSLLNIADTEPDDGLARWGP
jgi:hypothetical protein